MNCKNCGANTSEKYCPYCKTKADVHYETLKSSHSKHNDLEYKIIEGSFNKLKNCKDCIVNGSHNNSLDGKGIIMRGSFNKYSESYFPKIKNFFKFNWL